VLLSQLVLTPVLVIFCWVYFFLRPADTGGRQVMLFDIVTVATAVFTSVCGLVWVANSEFDHASTIWRPILSVLTTFHIFPLVLCIGWWLRRRKFS